jgi:hypothetical protein
MSIIEKKEKNLNQLINKLNSLSITYSQPNYEVWKNKNWKKWVIKTKNEIENKNQEIIEGAQIFKKKN